MPTPSATEKTADRLLAALGIGAGESSRVLWLMLHAAAFGASKVFLLTAGNALFVDAFGAAAYPWLYMVMAILTPLIAAALGKLRSTMPFSRYSSLLILVTAVPTVLLWLGLVTWQSRWLTVAIVGVADLLLVFGGLELWGLAGRLLNVREFKRLAGLVGAGDVAAMAVGGALSPLLVRSLGTESLLLFSAAGMAGGLAALRRIARRFSDRVDPDEERSAGGRRPEGRVDRRYLLLVYALSATLVSVYYFCDVMLYERLEARLVGPDAIAGFLGRLFSVIAVASLMLRLVSGRLLQRAGVVAALTAQPGIQLALCLGLVAAAVVSPGGAWVFWLVVGLKLSDRVLLDGLTRPSTQVLLQPLPPRARVRVQTFSVSVVESLAGGLAGLVLLVLLGRLEWTAGRLGFALLVLLAAWIFLNLLVGGHYQNVLVRALGKRVLRGSGTAIDERFGVELLRASLASPHAGEVLYGLKLLDESTVVDRAPLLAPLLERAEAEVRLAALESIGHHEIAGLETGIRRLIDDDPDPRIRAAALATRIVLGGESLYDEAARLLDSEVPALRRGALVGLLKSGTIEGIMLSGAHFTALERSPEAADRRLAAEIIGEVRLEGLHRPLARLLSDEVVDVRRAAIGACRAMRSPRIWPHLVANFSRPELRADAVSVAAQAGEVALPALMGEFSRSSRGDVRARIVRTCGRIAGAKTRAFLAANLAEPDADVRHTVLSALALRHFQATDREEVSTRLAREVYDADEALRAAAGVGERSILGRAILFDRQRSVDRALLLLSFLYPAETVTRIRAGLATASDEQHAYAIEALETLVEGDLRATLLATLEPASFAELRTRVAHGGRELDRLLRRLARGELGWISDWTRACALRQIGEARRKGLREVADGLRDVPVFLLRETARWALRALEDGAALGAEAAEVRTTFDRVRVLRPVSIFTGNPDRFLAEVATIAEHLEIPAGTRMIRKGQIEQRMFVVISGRVRVHDGERTLRELGKGAIFGELAVLDDEPRSASVTTLEPISVLSIDRGALHGLMADEPEVAFGLMRVLARRIRSFG